MNIMVDYKLTNDDKKVIEFVEKIFYQLQMKLQISIVTGLSQMKKTIFKKHSYTSLGSKILALPEKLP